MNDYVSVIEEIGCMQPLSLTAICGTHENCLGFAIFKNDESRIHHKTSYKVSLKGYIFR